MGDFQQYFDIILFAMVAGFLILRLRSVLGRRTGNERRRDMFARRPQAVPGKVAPLADRTKAPPPPTTIAAEPGDAVARGLSRIRGADANFDPPNFLEGARVAFDMIVAAFAEGDKAKLRPLLSDDVFQPFATAIDERMVAKETLETRVLRLKSIDIAEAELDGRTARVNVKFVSDQLNVTRAHDGSIVDGDPSHASEKTDYWTFARDTRSADPNWVVTATSSG